MERERESKPKEVIVVEPGERPPQRPPPPERSSEGIVLAGGTERSSEPPPPPPAKVFYKTKLCVNYDTSGRCFFGEHCAFAHGVAELRRPDVEMVDKACHNFRHKGTCYYGDNCIFSHASAAAPGLAIRNPEALPVTVRSETSSAPGRFFQLVPAPAVRERPHPEEQEAGGRRVSNLERLSRKNMRGIYGDWPEQY